MTARNKKTGEEVQFQVWNKNTIAFGKRLTEQELLNRGYSKFECRKSTKLVSVNDFYNEYELVR